MATFLMIAAIAEFRSWCGVYSWWCTGVLAGICTGKGEFTGKVFAGRRMFGFHLILNHSQETCLLLPH